MMDNFKHTRDNALCRYTGQNWICLSSATVASLETSPGKLKGKNVNLVINSNSQFSKRNLHSGKKNVSASNYLFLFR